MKKLVVRFGCIIASLAFMVTFVSANVTCACLAYQPKLPDSSKKLRRF